MQVRTCINKKIISKNPFKKIADQKLSLLLLVPEMKQSDLPNVLG